MKRYLILTVVLLACGLKAWPQALVDGIQPSAVNGITVATGAQFNGIALTAPGGGGANTLALHSGVVCNNVSTTSSTVSCTLTGVSAGDMVTVQVGENSCIFNNVTDSVNSGAYSVVYSNASDPSDANCSSQAYFLNSASGTIIVTASSTVSEGWLHIAAQAWTDSGGGSAPTLDSTFSSSGSPFFQTSASAATANCGTAKTPSAANELVIAYAEGDGSTYTHGTNYTALTTDSVNNPSAAQYWIQTTATSTNGAFVNTTDDWGAGCVAFKP